MKAMSAGLSAMAFCAVLGLAGDDAWERQLAAGRTLVSQGRYTEALETVEQARKQAEQFGPDDARLAIVLNNLGMIHSYLHDTQEAVVCFRRSAGIWKGRGDALNAVSPLTNLAGAYLARGQYSAAEALLRDALDLSTQKLGSDHPQTVAILAYLADSACLRHEYDGAARLGERVVEAVRKTHGPADPMLATALDNLGTVYRAQGRAEEAAQLFAEAIAVLDKSGQPENRAWIRALDDYSIVFFDRRRYQEADSLLTRSLALAEKMLGPYHPEVARVLADRAVVLRKAGRKAEARKLEARAARIQQQSARDNALGFTVDIAAPAGFRQQP